MNKISWARPYIDQEEISQVNGSLEANWLSQGPKVAMLESMFQELSGRKFCLAVSNGTIALDLALTCLGIKPGDEVIVPAHTYFATAASVARLGAVPVFADVEKDTVTIDPKDVERKITEKTKAIICVDLGGNPCDHNGLKEVAEGHNIPILSDAAQSLGGEFEHRSLFSFGEIATTSLHTAKTLNAVEGGMIFTDDEAIYDLLIRLRNQGEEPHEKFNHVVLGCNARMSDLHAAIGVAQMKRYDKIISKRASDAAFYNKLLDGTKGLETIRIREHAKNGWFFCSFFADRRDQLAEHLAQNGIETRITYPVPLYRQKALREFSYEICPNAEYTCSHIITLPMYFELSTHDIEFVVEQIVNFYS